MVEQHDQDSCGHRHDEKTMGVADVRDDGNMKTVEAVGNAV